MSSINDFFTTKRKPDPSKYLVVDPLDNENLMNNNIQKHYIIKNETPMYTKIFMGAVIFAGLLFAWKMYSMCKKMKKLERAMIRNNRIMINCDEEILLDESKNQNEYVNDEYFDSIDENENENIQ